MNKETNKTKKLKCKHCGYIWNYSGNAPFYATCPSCKYNVNTISGMVCITPKEVKK